MILGRHWDMKTEKHNTMSSNFYEQLNIFRNLDYLLKNEHSVHKGIKCALKKKKIIFIIHSKHFCLVDVSVRISKLKYIKQ